MSHITEIYKQQIPFLVSQFGYKIALIGDRYYNVDSFEHSTPNSQKHSLRGTDITDWINSSHFTPDGNTSMDNRAISTSFENHLHNSFRQNLEFHHSYSWRLWLP